MQTYKKFSLSNSMTWILLQLIHKLLQRASRRTSLMFLLTSTSPPTLFPPTVRVSIFWMWFSFLPVSHSCYLAFLQLTYKPPEDKVSVYLSISRYWVGKSSPGILLRCFEKPRGIFWPSQNIWFSFVCVILYFRTSKV